MYCLEKNYGIIWLNKGEKHVNTAVIAFYSWSSNPFSLQMIKMEISRKYQQNGTTVKKKPPDSLTESGCFGVGNCHKGNRTVFWNSFFLTEKGTAQLGYWKVLQMLLRCLTFRAATIFLVFFGSELTLTIICSNNWNAKSGKCFFFFIWKGTKSEPRLIRFCCDLMKWARFSLSCDWINERRIQSKASVRSKSLKSNTCKHKQVKRQW